MPSLDLLIPFFVASAVFACVPGPGMLYAAALTIAHGRRAGWLSAFGFHLAGYVHVAAAAFGLSLLLQAVPVLYTGVKLAGAAYLVSLGVRMMLSKPAAAAAEVAPGRPSPRHAVRQSIAVEVLNPKTALFYLAFLPQFADPSAVLPVWSQILVLGAIVNVLFSVTDVVCVLLSIRVGAILAASRRTGRIARRLGGGILVLLGVELAVARP